MRIGWLRLSLIGCFVSACTLEARPLSFKEAVIPVMGDTPAVTAKLEAGCKVIGTFLEAPTIHDQSLTTELRLAMGAPRLCFRMIASEDDIRRCAGERQAQVVQVLGRTTEIDGMNEFRALKVLEAMQSSPSATVSGTETETVGESFGYKMSLNKQTHEATRERTTSLDFRMWRCPALRATPTKRELVWRMGGSRLELLQDGQVVGNNGDLDKLPTLVAAHPVALDFAKQAVAEQDSAYMKWYFGMPLGVLSLGGIAVAAVGSSLHNYRLALAGLGGGIVSMSIGIPLLISGANGLQRAQTSAMNAVDAWNDDYVHGKAASVATRPASSTESSP